MPASSVRLEGSARHRVARRDADDRGEEDKVERLDSDQWLDELYDAKGGNDGEQCDSVKDPVDAPGRGSHAHRL